MNNVQLIEAINTARMTDSEKRTAIAALQTAERLVRAMDWIRGVLSGLGRGIAVKPALRA